MRDFTLIYMSLSFVSGIACVGILSLAAGRDNLARAFFPLYSIQGQALLQTPPAPGTDEHWLARNYVVVVPMQIDEVDVTVLDRWRTTAPALPPWRR